MVQLQAGDELIKVFTTASEVEALLVRSLLESAGIDAVLTWLDPLPRSVHPTAAGAMIRVLARHAGEAQRLIREYQAAGPSLIPEDGTP